MGRSLQAHLSPRGFRVFGDVRERFLRDAVQGGLDSGRQRSIDGRLHGDEDSPALRDTVGQKLEGRNQSEVIEDGRPELMREIAQSNLDLVQQAPGVLNPLGHIGRPFGADVRESEMHRCQELRGFVMQR